MRCPVCGVERSYPCPVCAMRSRVRRAEKENTRAYMSLPERMRKHYRSIEMSQGEPYPKRGTDEEKEVWAVGELTRRLVEIRKDTERMKHGARLSKHDERGTG